MKFRFGEAAVVHLQIGESAKVSWIKAIERIWRGCVVFPGALETLNGSSRIVLPQLDGGADDWQRVILGQRVQGEFPADGIRYFPCSLNISRTCVDQSQCQPCVTILRPIDQTCRQITRGEEMKVLFIISSSDTAFWLSEVTHPYWHLTERGVDVDFASPKGGKVVFDPYSDPYFEKSTEPDDLVSKGFLSDKALARKLDTTLKLKDVDLSSYDAIHVAGGRGATFDLYPNEDVAAALEYFWARDKVVGAICHGAIALGNIPERIRGRRVTGFTLEGDKQLQQQFGSGFLIPHYPQTVLEETGAIYTGSEPYAPKVVIDGKLITGQNQQSASEYALAMLHRMTGETPVSVAE